MNKKKMKTERKNNIYSMPGDFQSIFIYIMSFALHLKNKEKMSNAWWILDIKYLYHKFLRSPILKDFFKIF